MMILSFSVSQPLNLFPGLFLSSCKIQCSLRLLLLWLLTCRRRSYPSWLCVRCLSSLSSVSHPHPDKIKELVVLVWLLTQSLTLSPLLSTFLSLSRYRDSLSPPTPTHTWSNKSVFSSSLLSLPPSFHTLLSLPSSMQILLDWLD